MIDPFFCQPFFSSLIIREATIDELVAVNSQIAEFDPPYDADVLATRLDGVRYLGLVGEEDGVLLGFKVGYEVEPGVFYSWLGGVLEAARGKGLASGLMEAQEAWLVNNDYVEVRVKTRNVFRNMIKLLLKYEYLVVGVEPASDPMQNRILFSKRLK